MVRYCDYCEQAVVRIMQPRGERLVKGAGQQGAELGAELGAEQTMDTIVEAVQQAVKQVHS